MPDHEQLPILIGDIYDAGLDPSRWSAVLQDVARFVGGSAASLYSKDVGTMSGMVYYAGGDIDPHYRQTYFDTYVKIDPLIAGHVLAAVDQPTSTTDFMPLEEFAKSRMSHEWVKPLGLVDCVNVVLDKSVTGAALFGVFRQKQHGVVDDATRWRVRQLAPHIRRALTINRTIETKVAEAASLADTLDGLRAGMFLVDATGRIVHTNASGDAMAAEGSAVRVAGGPLTSADGKAAHALQQIFAAAGAGDAAAGAKGIAVTFAGRDGKCYAAHVLPLAAGDRRRAGARYAAVAAVFLREATIAVPSPLEAIAKHFQLTPSELRVLLMIVQGGGVAEAADALGVGEATVKTHLHRLFGKTGTKRQADLVKLVAGFSDPLVGENG
jgi:DNA-binding CsgD family transcriptional regulator